MKDYFLVDLRSLVNLEIAAMAIREDFNNDTAERLEDARQATRNVFVPGPYAEALKRTLAEREAAILELMDKTKDYIIEGKTNGSE